MEEQHVYVNEYYDTMMEKKKKEINILDGRG